MKPQMTLRLVLAIACLSTSLALARVQDSVVLVVGDKTHALSETNESVDIPGVVAITPGDPFSQISLRGNLPHETRVLFKDIEVHASCIDGMEPAHSVLSEFAALDESTWMQARGTELSFDSRNRRIEEPQASVRTEFSGLPIDYKVDLGAGLSVLGGNIYSQVYYANEQDYTDGRGNTIANNAQRGGLRIEFESEDYEVGLVGQYTGFNAYAQLLMDTRASDNTLVWFKHYLQRQSNVECSVTLHGQLMNHEMDDYDRPEQEIRERKFMPDMLMPMYSQREVAGATFDYQVSENHGMYGVTIGVSTQRWNAEMDMIALDDESIVAWMSNIANVQQHNASVTATFGRQLDDSWCSVVLTSRYAPSRLLDTRGKRLLSGWTSEVQPRHDVEFGVEGVYGTNIGGVDFESVLSYRRRSPKLQELYAFFFSDPFDEVAVIGNPQLEAIHVYSISLGVKSEVFRNFHLHADVWADIVSDDIRAVGEETKLYQHIGATNGFGGVIAAQYVRDEFATRFSAELVSRYATKRDEYVPVFSQPKVEWLASHEFGDLTAIAEVAWYVQSPFSQTTIVESLPNESAVLCELTIIYLFSTEHQISFGVENLLDSQFVFRGTSQRAALPGRRVVLSMQFGI